MKLKSLLLSISSIGLLWHVATVSALALPPIPTEPIYFEPPVVEATDNTRQFSCVELDNTIRYLHPYRYSYKPDFYQDDANKIATTLIMFDSIPIVDSIPVVKGLLGFAYLGYSTLIEEKEQRRTLQVEQQISMLQQLKAEKHCFE
ncbi:MAG: hypothetical protein OEY48_00705 [Gammaproteobacteria bacterium]|nr:hypothetical protein [Gammaproteobacteria bacterium]MDH5591349.1 hypothetical protein [Gammaproteobacteria bacterium]